MTASTRDIDALENVIAAEDAPACLAQAMALLHAAREEAIIVAQKNGREVYDRAVPIASVTLEEAYDALTWLDDRREHGSPLVAFKQGRTGRSHYRFVLELPNGLGPEAQHAVLERFCESLAEDGWMVVGAIHQPDPHADQRNPHCHVDGYDRKAAWLEEHNCWDFEYVTRRDGKPHRPFEQNKVRYDGGKTADGKLIKVNTATMMRKRFIEIVNDVVKFQPEIDPYVTGTYAENGVPLTPLKHMGNRAVSLEKRGVETEVGTVNARRILHDDLRACELRADQRRKELADQLRLLDTCPAAENDLGTLERYQACRLEIIDRQLQADLVDVVTTASRSRADTILRTFANDDRRRPAAPSTEPDIVEQARADVAWVMANSPSQAERDSERDRLAALDREAGVLLAQLSRHHDGRTTGTAPIRYLARDRKVPVTFRTDQHRIDQDRGRLLSWLDRHSQDEGKLVIESGTAKLGEAVQRSIDTLLVKMIDDEQVQRRLREEQQRRLRLQRQRKKPSRKVELSDPGADLSSAGSALADPIDTGAKHVDSSRGRRAEVRSQVDAAAHPRPSGLRPIGSLAGLRVLPVIAVDDRSAEAGRVLHGIRRPDVRGSGERTVHQPVRGDGVRDCEGDLTGDRRNASVGAPAAARQRDGDAAPSKQAGTAPPRNSLSAQAAGLAAAAPTRPKGREKKDKLPSAPRKGIER